MDFQDLLVDTSAEVATITLNRPAVLNALSPRLIHELRQSMDLLAADPSLKLIVVKGAGRAWSAGVDLKAMNEHIQGGQFAADEILKEGLELIRRMQSMPQLTIAQVHGHCYTGALELLMAFDLIIAAEDTKLGDTHAKWGILPKWGMTQRLPHLVGFRKALQMSVTARPISGSQAAEWGLINQAVPLDSLEEAVQTLLTDIQANSAQTVAAIKQMYYQGWNHSLAHGLQVEQDWTEAITDRSEFLRQFETNKGT
jgi:enoyl-CoA hydratase/carnithine racemase